ncbi:hypothetical protein PQI66_00385 [Corynebacterium sp. USCH3]|uniref:Gp37-like protein n=1 Tax=Corynebacterium sp. USCH3 TaxID=3024840 RepID=UPI0030A617D3
MVNTEALDRIAGEVTAAEQAREAASWGRQYVRVWDREGAFLDELSGEISMSVDDLYNDAGDLTVALPAEHFLAQWSLDEDIESIWSITVEDATHPRPWETRWSGTVAKVLRDVDEDGAATVTWQCTHDWRLMMSIVCWANPLTPAGLQVPKEMLLPGPSHWVIKNFLVMNLIRLYGVGWTPPENIWDPESWRDRWGRFFDWPIFCAPAPSLLRDTSPWTVLRSRFAYFSDLIGDTLNDGQLQLKVWRWVPGDEQPYPDYVQFSKPTIVVDVVEKSGKTDYTGTIIDGAIKYVSYLTEDLAETGWEAIIDPSAPTTPKTAGREAIPVWREDEHAGFDGVPGAGMEITKPTAWQVTHGGKSPGWVNTGVKLGVNSALGLLGNILMVPGLNGAFDDYLEDVLLAFAVNKSNRRKNAMGRFAPPETFISGGNGFSISTLQTGRTGLYDTRGYVGYTALIEDGQPYYAYWDFQLGDRVGVEQDGRVWITRVVAIKREWSRDSDMTLTITLGDPRHAELPEARLLKELAKVGGVLRALGVDA